MENGMLVKDSAREKLFDKINKWNGEAMLRDNKQECILRRMKIENALLLYDEALRELSADLLGVRLLAFQNLTPEDKKILDESIIKKAKIHLLRKFVPPFIFVSGFFYCFYQLFIGEPLSRDIVGYYILTAVLSGMAGAIAVKRIVETPVWQFLKNRKICFFEEVKNETS